MVNAINLNTEEAEAEDFCGFETALFYVVNFMKARATWCNAVLKKKEIKEIKKNILPKVNKALIASVFNMKCLYTYYLFISY